MSSAVALLRTRPESVVEDYGRLMRLVKYDQVVRRDQDLILKLNLSWTKYFPACSSQPWQVDGVLTTLLEDGYDRRRLFPVENKTVVTDPIAGCRNNKWRPVLERHGVPFIALPGVEWTVYKFQSPLLKLNAIFPEGIQIPKMYVGKNVCHLPTVKVHGHTTTTGAIKNAFGGLLKEVRHYAHEYIHEVMVDLMYMQRELHPSLLAVMDGTVMGDGAGPRTMVPRVGNLILASADQVALDAIAARIMGFDPLSIPYLRMCQERGLGVADPKRIEIVGDTDAAALSMGFKTSRSLVIWGDQLIRRGPLRPLKRLLLHSPLARHHRGTFILRIEDTDRSRSTDDNIVAIVDALRWLGLDWDEGPPTPGYRQTERLAIYREHAERLLRSGRAYYCDCPPELLDRERAAAQQRGETFRYSGRCRDRGLPAGALRLRIPTTGATVVNDLIHGPVTFEHTQLDDWILVRTDGTPTYNFCVVVDDVTMNITHVVRGDDHLSNTPKQILCYEALDYAVPEFAHVSMILGKDRSRLSKRHGATSVQAFRDAGYIADAMVNYLARLGWSHGDQEVFSRAELVELFDIKDVASSGAVFDPTKLEWLSQHYLKTMNRSEER